jgi:hypothetical protein
MKSMIWLMVFFCLSISAQTPLNPNQLIDRADLRDPKQYILDIRDQAQENLNLFRENKNKEMTGVTWSEKTFSFQAKYYPEQVDVPNLIDSLMSLYRAYDLTVGSDENFHSGSEKTFNQDQQRMNKVAVDLLERGLSKDEVRIFGDIALAKKGNTYGLHIQVTDLFQKQVKENGVDLGLLEKLGLEKLLGSQALESYYEFYFKQYHLTQAEVYGTFLGNFTLRSRRALLSYAYEKGLEWTDLHHTMKEPSAENWKETMLFMESEKGGQ